MKTIYALTAEAAENSRITREMLEKMEEWKRVQNAPITFKQAITMIAAVGFSGGLGATLAILIVRQFV